MKEQNNNKIEVTLKINGHKCNTYRVHTNNDVFGSHAIVAACINNKRGNEITKDLVERIKKALAFEATKELLWKKGAIEKILYDAYCIAPTKAVEKEIISLRDQLLPLIERIYDPATNALSKSDVNELKLYKTHEQVLTVLFGESFLELGIYKFHAKVLY